MTNRPVDEFPRIARRWCWSCGIPSSLSSDLLVEDKSRCGRRLVPPPASPPPLLSLPATVGARPRTEMGGDEQGTKGCG
ncbi:hypothetical protein Q1695_010605 [Nippostrongylus brasiliensis]|nr:hypothetical protein Q1695_010605 [Nippostrongylus brasiliensis]